LTDDKIISDDDGAIGLIAIVDGQLAHLERAFDEVVRCPGIRL
jgi:hypothetical protein